MEKRQIGETIRALRKNKGVTQEQLAEILEVSTPAVSKWENSQTYPDISLLPIIARYFQVSIDFLLGFSNELSVEDMKAVCDDVTQKFENLKFGDAQIEWHDYLRQFPNSYPLRYELATIGLFNIHKSSSLEEMYDFANKLIGIFEQCTKSDELKIKQGAYFQIANLHIMLQDFDRAQNVLSKIPTQFANPKFLLSMVYIGKNNLEEANKNIQENIYSAISDVIAELGNMISILRLDESGNKENILNLFYRQKHIITIFGLEPMYGVGVGLQLAQILAQAEQYEKVKEELEQVIDILEKHPQGIKSLKDIYFFKDTDLEIGRDRRDSSTFAYNILIKEIFTLIEENKSFQTIKSRLEQAIMKRG